MNPVVLITLITGRQNLPPIRPRQGYHSTPTLPTSPLNLPISGVWLSLGTSRPARGRVSPNTIFIDQPMTTNIHTLAPAQARLILTQVYSKLRITIKLKRVIILTTAAPTAVVSAIYRQVGSPTQPLSSPNQRCLTLPPEKQRFGGVPIGQATQKLLSVRPAVSTAHRRFQTLTKSVHMRSISTTSLPARRTTMWRGGLTKMVTPVTAKNLPSEQLRHQRLRKSPPRSLA